jgi:signal transduction histidine kinase
MVKATVEQHGGTVVIEDASIGGTRVRVRLPVA